MRRGVLISTTVACASAFSGMSLRRRTISMAVEGRQHFIRDMVEKSLAQSPDRTIVTRFPPEPNGYLHVGHAKAICLNFGLARDYGGRVHMRMDDTNPEKEEVEYERAILDDVRWLVGGDDEGGDPWDGDVRYASDYFDEIYEFAEKLIERDLAYVDSQSPEEMRLTRGTLKVGGTDSPYRDRSVEENLELFRKMKDGAIEEGGAVLRAKIDMASPNLNMRDPALYRVRKSRHARTGDKWVIYPMYDMAHALSDAIEGITHSLCTLEFQDHRPLYDWVVDRYVEMRRGKKDEEERPRQTEFSRLNLQYTVTSKRKLMRLVQDGLVEGWDDPRMPTLAGMRSRGVPPEALRLFCERIGISKADSRIDPVLLDDCTRDVLEKRKDMPRAFAVLKPLRLKLVDFEGEEDVLDERGLIFNDEIFIDREDFWDVEEDGPTPPKGYQRLVEGGRVRLRYAYVVKCEKVIRDEKTKAPMTLECTVERDTRQGAVGANGKVKGIIHWLSKASSDPAKVALYERLFQVEAPEGDDDDLNPASLELCENALVERFDYDDIVQFERLGYFKRRTDDGNLDAFQRVVALRSTWQAKFKEETTTTLSPELEAASLLDLVAGVVVECEPHPESESLWCLQVECGDAETETRPIAAGIRSAYPDAQDLIFKQVVLLRNTKPRKIAGFQSHGMLLCAIDKDDKDNAVLLQPPSYAVPGTRLTPKGLHSTPPAPPSQVKNKKLWEKAQPAFATIDDHTVCVDGRPLLAPEPDEGVGGDDENAPRVVVAPDSPAGCQIA